jgi:predicted GH43/DUF377 family glycosyl hydrolase
MKWKKHGLIYNVNGKYEWNKTHAQVPVVDIMDEKTWRIFYSTRDAQNKSRISFIEVEAGNPSKILFESNQPVLDSGKLGSFDDCGVMPAWIINNQNQKWLYYIGWTTRGTIPYHNSIGLAASDDGGKSFKKFAEGPIFGLTYKEPYFSGTICVIKEDMLWRSWYLNCVKWEMINGKAEPFYHIKYAESADGINWRREAKIAIDFKNESEGGIASASVLKENGQYKMWFCCRGADGYRTNMNTSYRIGYAESKDGIEWKRKDDEAGIDVSENGWDSQMICYPNVISFEEKKYMFYNGNGFGQSGFGFAKLE